MRKKIIRFSPIIILLIALIGFLVFGGWKYLKPQFLADNFVFLEEWVAQNNALAALIFVAFYAFCCAIALPSVLILSLCSGMFFGGILGGFLSSLAATIGAVILYYAANKAVGHHIIENSGNLINKFGKYFKKYEFTNLLGLRLIPIAPFFVITIAAAAFHVRIRNFILATFLGILPVEMSFAYLGVGLRSKFNMGQIPQIGDFLSTNIIAPMIFLSLLAIMPNIIDFVRKK